MIKTGEENLPDNKIILFVTKNFVALRMEASNNGGQTLEALSALTGKSVNLLIPAINAAVYPSELINTLISE